MKLGFLVLLSQLTDVGNVTKEQFLSKFLQSKIKFCRNEEIKLIIPYPVLR